MTSDRSNQPESEQPENGVLDDSGDIDTTDLGLLGTSTVNITLPVLNDDGEDDVIDDAADISLLFDALLTGEPVPTTVVEDDDEILEAEVLPHGSGPGNTEDLTAAIIDIEPVAASVASAQLAEREAVADEADVVEADVVEDDVVEPADAHDDVADADDDAHTDADADADAETHGDAESDAHTDAETHPEAETHGDVASEADAAEPVTVDAETSDADTTDDDEAAEAAEEGSPADPVAAAVTETAPEVTSDADEIPEADDTVTDTVVSESEGGTDVPDEDAPVAAPARPKRKAAAKVVAAKKATQKAKAQRAATAAIPVPVVASPVAPEHDESEVDGDADAIDSDVRATQPDAEAPASATDTDDATVVADTELDADADADADAQDEAPTDVAPPAAESLDEPAFDESVDGEPQAEADIEAEAEQIDAAHETELDAEVVQDAAHEPEAEATEAEAPADEADANTDTLDPDADAHTDAGADADADADPGADADADATEDADAEATDVDIDLIETEAELLAASEIASELDVAAELDVVVAADVAAEVEIEETIEPAESDALEAEAMPEDEPAFAGSAGDYLEDDSVFDVFAPEPAGLVAAVPDVSETPLTPTEEPYVAETTESARRTTEPSARVQPVPEMKSKRLGDLQDAATGETADLLTADRLLDPNQLVKPEPEGAWRHLVYSLSGKRINLGDSKAARERKQLTARIAAPLPGGSRFVPVLSRKGGVGKTTATTLLGMALADARDDRIVAVDANPDRGTLAERIGRSTQKTIRDLVRVRDEIRGFNDLSALVARDETRLDVLASDSDPRVAEAFSDDDYRAVADVASRYYSIVLTDCGTGIVHSVMGATLDLADRIVIVAGLSVDEARLASETLTWLDTNGYGDLARDAIVVLNQTSSGAPVVRLNELESHFRSRVRDVVRLPYDPLIASGSAITFRDLQPETRLAARELAALVVAGLRDSASA